MSCDVGHRMQVPCKCPHRIAVCVPYVQRLIASQVDANLNGEIDFGEFSKLINNRLVHIACGQRGLQ